MPTPKTPLMAICFQCGSDTVYPEDWEPTQNQWSVSLFCPNCENKSQGVFSQEHVEDFDDWLDDCQDELRLQHQLLVRENMSTYLETFITALNADNILPEDF